MRRTIINLTRFGDLLQTQPIIDALRRQGQEPGLICLDNFAGAVELLDGVEFKTALPGARILAGISDDWRVCVNGMKDWCKETREQSGTASVLNLTPTLAARLLSRMLQEEGQPEGFSLDEFGFGCNSNAWATYVQATSLKRGCSPFNLVDGFRMVAGVGDMPAVYRLKPPVPETTLAIREKLAAGTAKARLHSGQGYVGFQLGASDNIRRWPVDHFADLGRRLYETAGLVPLLLGSQGELHLAERYLENGAPGVNLAGATSLPELAAVLTACTLLVSNDTGTMHLAAGLGTPVLAIFLATAQPWDTGPYQENMCSLEPRVDCHPCGFSTICPHEERCRSRISAHTVAGLITDWLVHRVWPIRDASSEAAREARIWLSRRDSFGFMDLASLSDDERTDRTVWIRLQRAFYRRLLDDMEPSAEKKDLEDANPGYPLSPATRDRLLGTLATADSLLLLATEQARLLSIRPSDNARKNLLATCERVTRHFDTGPDFLPLSWLWRDLLQEFADNFDDLLRFFSSLRRTLLELSNKINEL